MKSFLKILPFAAVLILTILLVVKINQNGSIKSNSLFQQSHLIGHELPKIEGKDLFNNKKNFNLTKTNKFMLINFFASWCVSCLDEHKHFMRFYNANEKFEIIGIAWRDKKNDAINWLMQNGNPYNKVINDDLGKVGVSLGIKGLPETFLVSPDQKILMHYRGNIDEEFLERVKEKILNY